MLLRQIITDIYIISPSGAQRNLYKLLLPNICMDLWIQRIFAVGYIAIALALIVCMLSGRDGDLLGIISGMIVGIAAGLGISNAQILKPKTNES
jgi:hypothetical protein